MMKKRLQIGKLLKGDKRLEGETFVEYKERLKLEKSLLNEMILNVHEQFITDIYKVREKKIVKGLEGLREYAQGQIFSGQGAKDRGLVDEIAGLWQAGRQVHEELKLKEKFGLKFIKLKKDFKFTDMIEGIEETAKDLNFAVKNHAVPLLLHR